MRLLGCGVGRSFSSPRILVHDPTYGPYLRISNKILDFIFANEEVGNIFDVLLPLPKGVNLNFVANCSPFRSTPSLSSYFEFKNLYAYKLVDNFPTLRDRLRELDHVSPDHTVLLDAMNPERICRSSEFSQLIGDRNFNAVTKELIGLGRFFWLSISETVNGWQLFGWDAAINPSNEVDIDSGCAIAAVFESDELQCEISPSFRSQPLAISTRHTDKFSYELAEFGSEKKPIDTTLITSFTAGPLDKTLQEYWPSGSITPEPYLFSVMDIRFIRNLLKRPALQRDNRSNPNRLGNFLDEIASSQELISILARKLKDIFETNSLNSPAAFATYFPNAMLETTSTFGIDSLRAVALLAIELKKPEYGFDNLSVIEFVGGSTTSHLKTENHNGVYNLVNYPKSRFTSYREILNAIDIATRDGLKERMEEAGLTFSLELEPGKFNCISSVDRCVEFVSLLDKESKLISLNLDIGHYLISRHASEDVSRFDETLEELAHYFSHAHISKHYLKCHFADSWIGRGRLEDEYKQMLNFYVSATTQRRAKGLPASNSVAVELECTVPNEAVIETVFEVQSYLDSRTS